MKGDYSRAQLYPSAKIYVATVRSICYIQTPSIHAETR